MAEEKPRRVRRKARLEDIHELAMALLEVTCEAAGNRPAYQVRGQSFLLFRGPRKDAVDDETGEPLQDVLIFWVPSQEDKEAMLQGGPPWFTTPHFSGYNAVLLREAHVSQVTRAELEEVICDAWRARAPKRLATEWAARAPPTPR